MKKINIKIRQSNSVGLFHDSREDVRNISAALNICIDKINELVEENNKLKAIVLREEE